MMRRKKWEDCSFFGSRSSSSHHRKPSVGEAKTVIFDGVIGKAVVSQTSSVGNASISQTMDGETSSIWVGGKDWNTFYNGSRSNSKRSRLRNDMNRGGSLFGSQTTSSSIIESSLEFSLGSSDLLHVIQVGGSDLRSLYIIVDWMEGVRTESCVPSCFSGIECSLECSLGLSNFRSVLNGSRSNSKRSRLRNDMYRSGSLFVHGG